MGGRAALLQWKSWNVRRFLCRSYAALGSHCPPSSFSRNLSLCHGEQLSRRLDLPKRCVRTVVQRVLDVRLDAGHPESSGKKEHERNGWCTNTPLDSLSAAQCARIAGGSRSDQDSRALLPRLAGSPHLRRLLAALVH